MDSHALLLQCIELAWLTTGCPFGLCTNKERRIRAKTSAISERSYTSCGMSYLVTIFFLPPTNKPLVCKHLDSCHQQWHHVGQKGVCASMLRAAVSWRANILRLKRETRVLPKHKISRQKTCCGRQRTSYPRVSYRSWILWHLERIWYAAAAV